MKRVLNLASEPAALTEHLLEELIYQRLRLAVDVCEILTFREDLSTSVERALARRAHHVADRADLTMQHLHRAWDRLGEEILSELAHASFLDGERPATFRASPRDD